ncbi:yrhG [Symbiodinium sp. CCMP2592]|nr:yrhG [Symbiodinium sp. CCMP2592]
MAADSLAWVTPTHLAATRTGLAHAAAQGHLSKALPSSTSGTPKTTKTLWSAKPALAVSLLTSAVAVGGRRTRRRLRAVHSEPGRIVASPQETYEAWVQKARNLQEEPWSKTFYAAYVGGCFVGMAGLLSLVVGGNITANPTVRNLLFAALFPVNLLLVLQTGAQLFTGNAAIMAIGAFEGQVTLKSLLRNWGLSFLGNLLGCLTLSAVAQYTGMLTGGAASMAIEAVLSRCSSSFGQTLVKGVMCNWLLCAAIWLSTMAKGLSGKMVGIWFPISMFVGIGFEHSITNIFLLSSGLSAGAPATAAEVIMKNLVPATIGNALAGALIVGAGMSYAFGRLGRAKKSLRLTFPSRRGLEEGALVTQ